MKLSSIHVKSLAINSANISTETIDGDEHIVIRGVVPVVDDVVMNGGLYPAEEINKSFKTLEGNQMPLGHPKIGGDYVSANNPRAVNQFHVGAWAENVRKDGDRVVMDMKINKRFASATEGGKRVLERIEGLSTNTNTEPIHVSTGLLLKREQNIGKSKGNPLLNREGGATASTLPGTVGFFSTADKFTASVAGAEASILYVANMDYLRCLGVDDAIAVNELVVGIQPLPGMFLNVRAAAGTYVKGQPVAVAAGRISFILKQRLVQMER